MELLRLLSPEAKRMNPFDRQPSIDDVFGVRFIVDVSTTC
jgi:hypothetical protein